MGRAVGRAAVRARWPDRGRVPAAARARAPVFPLGHQLPRKHRCDEEVRRDRPRVVLRLRLLSRGTQPGHFRARGQFRGPYGAAGELVFRSRVCRARSVRAPGRPCAAGPGRKCGDGGGHRLQAWRHRGLHGGPAVLVAGGVALVSPGRLRHRAHDLDARGEARPRGGDHLRGGGDGHRLRLLAPDARLGRRRGAAQGHGREPRPGAAALRAAGEGFSVRASCPARCARTARSTAQCSRSRRHAIRRSSRSCRPWPDGCSGTPDHAHPRRTLPQHLSRQRRLDRRGDRPDAAAVCVRGASPQDDDGRRRGDQRHGGARCTAHRRDGRLWRGTRHA